MLLLSCLLLCSCKKKPEASSNSIFVIVPYRHADTWVFDDSRRGLIMEPFVSGTPEMIDKLVANIPDAEKGFRLLFSARPFPGYTHKLLWRRSDTDGNWYYSEEFKMEGWLCPALMKYFKRAPKEIYIKTEPKQIQQAESSPAGLFSRRH